MKERERVKDVDRTVNHRSFSQSKIVVEKIELLKQESDFCSEGWFILE